MTIDFGETKLKIGFSFFLVAALMLLLSDGKITLMCFFSSMAHEFGHLFPMFLFSQKVSVISFGAFGVRIDREGEALQSYKEQVVIALGGVAVNFLICTFSLAYCALKKSINAEVLFFVNLFMASLNLMPAKNLDAWNALYCILMMKKSEGKTLKILFRVSFCAVLAFAVFCVVYFIAFGFNASLAAVLIYLIFLEFIRNGEA